LIYSVHQESDILFRKDLDSWFDRTPNWQLFYVVTSQPDWDGLNLRLTTDKLDTLLGEDLPGTFFLCGPLGLIQSIRKHLFGRSVKKKRVRKEEFVFLP
jgi:ferredoxin-NADP reductase